ncbi:polysaccharide deacetylase family protein [Luteibacter sp. PPL201]|jgi:peptidoglycan/xylan/chitin deacetylase (PgdA/CDA1 family)|uniref:Polysaccharide deacetylase family protein n=1 Tax=Luteibacter sahnii TaxID=3021977 RepID=A0ABT6BCL0_9GAMM|nr:polysaccharide deacetylase family protein [Luteibacter sp. PPL193]MDY1549299.1 polysaccharide deacetylase family protein [Luteibacter sp. PPL193]
MVTDPTARGAPGIRGRLGELCYASGLLHSLQKVRAWWQHDLRILAYHRVMPLPDPATYPFDLELISTPPHEFREQMKRIKRHFRPMRLTDVAAALDAGEALPPDTVAVTFDDGYDDNYHVAAPILDELGVPATFFVSTGHIDSGRPYAYDWLVHMILVTGAPRLALPELGIDVPMPRERPLRRRLAGQVLLRMKWLDALGQSAMTERLEAEWNLPSADARPRQCRPMTWDQIRAMERAGLEIGSHGVHHRMLARLPLDEMTREIRQSKATLDRELAQPAILMSYPVGGDRAYNDAVISATRNAGFRLACSYVCGTNAEPSENRYALHRLPVESTMGPGWFAAMLALPQWMTYPTVAHEVRGPQDAPCSP